MNLDQSSSLAMGTTIQDLCPELLVKIFTKYIESEGHMNFSRYVIPVCKTWATLSATPSLWKTINVENWSYVINLAERGLLCCTRALILSHAAAYNFRNCEVSLNLLCLWALLPHVRELKFLKISHIAIHSDMMETVAKYCPNLHHLQMISVRFMNYHNISVERMNPFLDVCGANLKSIKIFRCDVTNNEELLSLIFAKCRSLEVLEWHFQSSDFPIHELMRGCPQLKKLEISDCTIDTAGGSIASGFTELKSFIAFLCDFQGLDVCSLLQNSKKFEHLDVYANDNMLFSGVANIPSKRIKFINVQR